MPVFGNLFPFSFHGTFLFAPACWPLSIGFSMDRPLLNLKVAPFDIYQGSDCQARYHILLLGTGPTNPHTSLSLRRITCSAPSGQH